MADYTKLFNNKVSDINNLGKERGFKNGVDMAYVACQNNIISKSEFAKYKNTHNIRNSGAHGFAGDISITKETYNFVCAIFSKLNSSKLKGGYKGKSSSSTNKNNQTNKKIDFDKVKRFSGNKKVTIENVKTILGGHEFIILLEGYHNRITIVVYDPRKDSGDIDDFYKYDDIVYDNYDMSGKDRVILKVKGVFLNKIKFDIDGDAFIYSIKEKRIIG